MIVFCRARSLHLLAKPAELRAWIRATTCEWASAPAPGDPPRRPGEGSDAKASGRAADARLHRPLLLDYLAAETGG